METGAEVEEEDEAVGIDPTEVLRYAVLLLGLAMNAYILWDYMKDRTEVLVWRQRARNWWQHTVEAPRRIKRQGNQVIFEAMTVVEEAKP